MKEVKDHVHENYETLEKEIKEDTRRWKDFLCSWVERIGSVYISILPKALYKFDMIPTKFQ
jgi:hypothetical protein